MRDNIGLASNKEEYSKRVLNGYKKGSILLFYVILMILKM